MGFEPTNGGFADLSLGPLGYRAKLFSIAKTSTSVRALQKRLNRSDGLKQTRCAEIALHDLDKTEV